MANHDGRSHENDTYAAYDGEVSNAELGNLQPTPTWAQQQAHEDSDYASSVLRHAYAYVRQQQQDRAQGAAQRSDAGQDRQGGLADPHRKTAQAKDTRSYAQGKAESASLTAIQGDRAQRDETAVSAALKEDQARLKNAQRSSAEQTMQQGQPEKQQEQQRGKEKQHDKGPARGR